MRGSTAAAGPRYSQASSNREQEALAFRREMDRLIRVFAIRRGEGRLVALVAGAFAAVEAGRGLGEVGVDTLVLSRSGAEVLPSLYIGLGLVGLIVTLSYGAALSRSRSEHFFPALLLLLAAVLAVEWLIALSGVEAIYPFVWISVYAAGLLLLTAMWTVGGFTFDARQAKRLFPLLTSAAIVGSLAGFLSAIVVQRIIGAEFLILAEAMLFVVAAGLLRGLGSRVRPRHQAGEATPSLVTAVTSGASYVAGSPLMRLVAVAYVLLSVLMFSLTFPFMSAMSEAFPDESELLTMLALFSAAVTVASFLAGTLLANRLYAWLGVATVAVTLPVIYLFGFGLWMVRFTLLTAVIVRFSQQVAQRGLTNAAFSAFYSVIPSRRRGQVMAFMDGVPGQLGTMLSGVLLIIATSLALEQVFVMGAVAALLAIAVVLLIRHAYAASLVATLREGLGEQVLEGGPGLAAMATDSRVIAELRVATSSERASERQLSADLLGRLGADDATADLERLTGDEEASVRRTALEALTKLAPDSAEPSLEQALNDEDAGVRATAIESLCRIGAQDALDSATEVLARDPDPRVRCELAVALESSGQDEAARRIIAELLADESADERMAGLDAVTRLDTGVEPFHVEPLLSDDAAPVRAAAIRAAAAHQLITQGELVASLADADLVVRTAAATALAARPTSATAVMAVLESGTDREQEAALLALGDAREQVRPALVEWSNGQVLRATELRRHARVLAGTDEAGSAAFLGQVVRRRESAIEARMLTALAILGAPEASGLIRRSLHAHDAEIRAQAIEAVDALGDAKLARGVVRLLDSEIAPAGAVAGVADVIATAQALSDDRDPWVRALALRTLSEYLEDGRRTLVERVRTDPDALIRETVEMPQGVVEMTESIQLVSDIDRMLVLRSVPLFEALTPEDLQRVAKMAAERSWAPDDALMTEGDVGNELVVIVEGTVRVVRVDDAGEQALRTYGPGDHIGELAVLREAPRAATVFAEAPGVRGLVIDGEAVQAILRERPDAAMAMLATLADRLGAQR